jgi:hypothetical protein
VVKNKKLGVIVPYRNREEHLKIFKEKIVKYLSARKILYEIIIVNQDNAKLFNRGMLLNIGFKIAEELGCEYVVFHDVDMIPERVDYSYSDTPLHMATNFKTDDSIENKNEIFEEYFGGVTMFTMDTFRKIDGYSNKYWGWGYEDTDLLHRCRKNNIKLDTWKIKNTGSNGPALKFNGINSYVRGINNINLNNNTTIFISFYPSDVICNYEKDIDEYSTFSIPGYDTSISYNSFFRYNFCTFSEDDKTAFYCNSKIKPNYKTNITLRFDTTNNFIDIFQDGELIDKIYHFEKLIKYNKPSFFYLGVGDPNREHNPKYFKGNIDSFVVFNELLEDDEILEISKNKYFGLTQNFGDYRSSHTINTYYDCKFIKEYKLIDLSGNKNDGEIVNCEIIEQEIDEYKEIKIPHRRESTFKLLSHKENGFFNNKWRNQCTRWNQLRYINEVLKNDELIHNDGLSNLEFIEYGRIYENNITEINVGL